MIQRIATVLLILASSLALLSAQAVAQYDIDELKKEIQWKEDDIASHQRRLKRLPEEISSLSEYTDPSLLAVKMNFWMRGYIFPVTHIMRIRKDALDDWVDSVMATNVMLFGEELDYDREWMIANILSESEAIQSRLRQEIALKEEEMRIARSRIPGLQQEITYLQDRVAELETAGVATATAEITEWDFGIVDTSYPHTIESGAKRENLIVDYTGTPKFPLKMILRPVTCPAEFTCGTEERSFYDKPKGKVSLVGANMVYCYGIWKAWHMDYEVVLKDAAGNETPPMPVKTTCNPKKD